MKIIEGRIGLVTLPRWGECEMRGAVYRYAPDQQAIQITSHEHGPIVTMTVCLPEDGGALGPGEFFVQTYNFIGGLREALLSSTWFEDTGKRVPSGYVQIEVWRWSEEAYPAIITEEEELALRMEKGKED